MFVGCGWCAGAAGAAKLTAHERALENTAALLRRIRQEIAYRRADLGGLCAALRAEGLIGPECAALCSLPAPPQLTKSEAECFAECVSALGRAGAEQECERLDYYIARFDAFLSAARLRAQSQTVLYRKLGLAAGAVAALLFI